MAVFMEGIAKALHNLAKRVKMTKENKINLDIDEEKPAKLGSAWLLGIQRKAEYR